MIRGLFLFLCLALAALFGALGVWQVQRLQWKEALIDRVEARLAADPAPPPSREDWSADQAYVRVAVRGRFDHGKETLVQALTERGAGFWVLTPLRTARGTFLINRGFVPAERRDPASRREGLIDGEVTVAGLLRATEPGGGFLRANDPEADRWHSRDVAAIAAARGLAGPVMPYFIDADATPNPGGWPLGGLTVVRFSNNHLVYALTWFGLGLTSLIGAGLILRRRRRG